MSKPKMKVIVPEMVTLWNDNQKAAQEANRQRCQATRARFARDKLARESNLTMAPKYRPCPDGCGMTLLWSNPGYHPTPVDLEPEGSDAAPVETPRLRDAVSQAQVLWSRDMITQYPRKSREQIERENNISWAQLEHFAKTPLSGLPERATRQAKEQAKVEAVEQAKPKAVKAPKAQSTTKPKAKAMPR